MNENATYKIIQIRNDPIKSPDFSGILTEFPAWTITNELTLEEAAHLSKMEFFLTFRGVHLILFAPFRQDAFSYPHSSYWAGVSPRNPLSEKFRNELMKVAENLFLLSQAALWFMVASPGVIPDIIQTSGLYPLPRIKQTTLCQYEESQTTSRRKLYLWTNLIGLQLEKPCRMHDNCHHIVPVSKNTESPLPKNLQRSLLGQSQDYWTRFILQTL